MAMNTRVPAGRVVQIISMVCPSKRNRLIVFLGNSLDIKYPTMIVIPRRIERV